MTTLRAACVAIAGLVTACGTPAQTPPPDADSCLTCHAPAARPDGSIPSLAGLERERFIQRMQAFRDGEGSIMNRIAPAYSDAEIARLAAYFAELDTTE